MSSARPPPRSTLARSARTAPFAPKPEINTRCSNIHSEQRAPPAADVAAHNNVKPPAIPPRSRRTSAGTVSRPPSAEQAPSSPPSVPPIGPPPRSRTPVWERLAQQSTTSSAAKGKAKVRPPTADRQASGWGRGGSGRASRSASVASSSVSGGAIEREEETPGEVLGVSEASRRKAVVALPAQPSASPVDAIEVVNASGHDTAVEGSREDAAESSKTSSQNEVLELRVDEVLERRADSPEPADTVSPKPFGISSHNETTTGLILRRGPEREVVLHTRASHPALSARSATPQTTPPQPRPHSAASARETDKGRVSKESSLMRGAMDALRKFPAKLGGRWGGGAKPSPRTRVRRHSLDSGLLEHAAREHMLGAPPSPPPARVVLVNGRPQMAPRLSGFGVLARRSAQPLVRSRLEAHAEEDELENEADEAGEGGRRVSDGIYELAATDLDGNVKRRSAETIRVWNEGGALWMKTGDLRGEF